MGSHDAQILIETMMVEGRMVHLSQNLRMLNGHIHLMVLLHTQPRQKQIILVISRVYGKKQWDRLPLQ